MSFLDQTLAIVWKDVLCELRTKETVVSVLVFALLVIIIFSFAFPPTPQALGLVAPGILWVTFSFAGVLGLNRSFVLEKDQGCLEGLRLCPVDRGVIYLGKMVGILLLMLVVEAITLPVFAVLLNISLHLPQLVLVTLLATLGFCAVGTLFSAISVNTRAREILLPILLLPVAVPVLIAAVKASGVALETGAWGQVWFWLRIILAFDAVFLVLCFIVFEYVIEE